jgi:hypothetical protein
MRDGGVERPQLNVTAVIVITRRSTHPAPNETFKRALASQPLHLTNIQVIESGPFRCVDRKLPEEFACNGEWDHSLSIYFVAGTSHDLFIWLAPCGWLQAKIVRTARSSYRDHFLKYTLGSSGPYISHNHEIFASNPPRFDSHQATYCGRPTRTTSVALHNHTI